MYTQELSDKICLLISQGVSLSDIENLDGMPSRQTIWKWAFKNPQFLTAYEEAQRLSADSIIERIEKASADMLDAPPEDAMKWRTYIDTLKWKVGKFYPRRFGDKMVVAGDKDNPIAITLAHALDDRIAAYQANRTIDHVASEVMTLSVLPVMDAETDE